MPAAEAIHFKESVLRKCRESAEMKLSRALRGQDGDAKRAFWYLP